MPAAAMSKRGVMTRNDAEGLSKTAGATSVCRQLREVALYPALPFLHRPAASAASPASTSAARAGAMSACVRKCIALKEARRTASARLAMHPRRSRRQLRRTPSALALTAVTSQRQAPPQLLQLSLAHAPPGTHGRLYCRVAPCTDCCASACARRWLTAVCSSALWRPGARRPRCLPVPLHLQLPPTPRPRSGSGRACSSQVMENVIAPCHSALTPYERAAAAAACCSAGVRRSQRALSCRILLPCSSSIVRAANCHGTQQASMLFVR